MLMGLDVRTFVWYTVPMQLDQLMGTDESQLTDRELANAILELRAALDAGEGVFSRLVHAFRRRGGHLADGAPTMVSWLTHTCKISSTAAADRLCVGKQLESLPEVADALASGAIGFQSASAVCHLREQLGDNRAGFDEHAMVGYAKQFRVAQLRLLCRHARFVADPDGFERDAQKSFERRWLHVSPMLDGMHCIDGVLDAEGGAAVKSALESLAHWRGSEDTRSKGQRMADALVEMTMHALDSGKLPTRHGAKPHLNVTVSLDGLRGIAGAAAAELQPETPISRKTFERICCDSTVSRVMLADSMVTDVGRATRSVSPPTRRALAARDKRCRWHGCDRPVSWTSPHHIEFWTRGGPTRLPNLLSLCFFHHRLVHEGGWQVVKVDRDFQFIPPERDVGWAPLRAA
jgi:hypothetical protein